MENLYKEEHDADHIERFASHYVIEKLQKTRLYDGWAGRLWAHKESQKEIQDWSYKLSWKNASLPENVPLFPGWDERLI